MKALGGLTNCRVELEVDGGTITVRAERLPDVEKAIMKLKSIDDWVVSDIPASFGSDLTCSAPTFDISTLL